MRSKACVNIINPPLKTIFGRELLLILFILTATVPSALAQTCTGIPEEECQALYALYNDTNGDQWIDNTNWLSDEPVSTWYGITVSGGNVVNIQSVFNGLAGSIPPELGNLTSLEELNLQSRGLTGSIPPELGNLTHLQSLDITSDRTLSGGIPPELGSLTNLHHLNLDYNNLTGLIPPELGNLTSLTYLRLARNKLTGAIPPELGNLTSLIFLYLYDNNLTGSIPPALGNLTSLQSLNLQYNNLTGSIPQELGNLPSWGAIDLRVNKLSGDLPAFLATPPEQVDLKWNCLYASDPAVLAAMEDKHSNMFMSTQTVPPDNVTAETIESGGTSENRIRVSWNPISFVNYDGGYKVFYKKGDNPDYYYFGMTTDKEASSLVVSNLEPDVEYTFRVNTVTWKHSYSKNDLESLDSNTTSAVSGTLSRAFIPAWKQSPGYFTGVVVSNFGDTDFDLTLSAYGQEGDLELLNHNPRAEKVAAGKQMSRLGSEFLGANGHDAISWIELDADNSNRMGSIFLFGVSDTQMLDGAEAQSSYAKKLYFTRPLDEGFFQGWQPEFQMCIVNPTDEQVTVTCTLKGSNGESGKTHIIPSKGFIVGNAEDLIANNHGIINGYMEIIVTEGEGVVGFSRIEFPGVRTALGMNAVEYSQSKKMYSAQLAHGCNIVTNLRLVNTSGSTRNVTLTVIGDNGIPLSDPVHVGILSQRIYSADLGTLFGLEGEGTITTGSLVVESDGSGVIGDIIFADGDTLEYAMALSLQDNLFQEAVFNHISNLPTVFTGFAFYNPGNETATVLIEAFGVDEGKVAEKTLILGPGERIARTLTDPDVWPAFPIQSGGFIRIQSDQPIAGQQLFGDKDLRYMAAIPPTTRVEEMFD